MEKNRKKLTRFVVVVVLLIGVLLMVMMNMKIRYEELQSSYMTDFMNFQIYGENPTSQYNEADWYPNSVMFADFQ